MDPSLQILIDRLNQLSEQVQELREGVQKAISIAGEDPEMALIRARKVLEYVVRDVFQRRLGEPPGTRPLENLIQQLRKDKFLPELVYANATSIRMLGNIGAHNWKELVTTAQVYQSLTQLMPILEWYFENERPEAGVRLDLPHKPHPEGTETVPKDGSRTNQAHVPVVPKGLRSFDANDSNFFLQLLPGPRDQDGLPESIRFWKHRIEDSNDLTFTVGLIYGPSGCGKSSLVKAGLLPRLAKRITSVYVEATPDETETRLLNGLRRKLATLPADLDLKQTISAIRQGQGVRADQKIVIVLDQFEQWLHAHRTEQDTELARALRQCDSDHVQCVLMVRDDFWVSLTRFMGDLGIDILQGQNTALVDLFDPIHARKVLAEFGRSYGRLSDDHGKLSKEQDLFLNQAVQELAQDGRVISIRLALFAEMVKGRPWSPATLKEVGGTEGVGVAFLEEMFASTALRSHQKAAQAVLKKLLPESGTDIKGNMRSQEELREASGYAERPREFGDLLRILDSDLRLITPADPESSTGGGQPASPKGERYFQLTHDYLVHSLRDWLARKQRESRRGRAELRLAELSSLWNSKPENRHLPSALEWANIRLLTRKKDWNESQRRMMKRAGRLHELRTLGVIAGLVTLVLLGLDIRRRVVEANREAVATGLVDQVVRANIAQVPNIVRSMGGYRRWVDPALRQVVGRSSERSSERLHAGLALLPVDDGQVEYLFQRLQDATADEVPVLRDALEPHQTGLTPKLWSVLDSAKPGDPSLLPAASSLALYNPQSPRWTEVAAKVAQGLVTTDLVYLRTWLDALRPVRTSLTAPLAAIFRDKSRPESEHALATSILADYASGDPNLVANLLMDAQPKAYASLFPIAQRLETKTFQDEIAKRPEYSWNDPPLDPSWTRPDATLTGKIESAQGMLAERFAFCQTMPLDEFLTTAEALRPSGYRPTRFRPYANGKNVLVAAVWVRDSRPWRLAHDQSTDEIRQTDERNRKEGYLSVDVAGYLAAGEDDGKPTPRFAALWALRTGPDDDARMVVASSVAELTKVQEQLKDAGLVPLTLHAWRQADDKLSYSGVWHKTASGTSDTALLQKGLWEADLPSVVDQQAGPLIDLDLTAAPPPPSTKERAVSALQVAEVALRAKPDDLKARFARASAYFQLGENPKAIDDLNAVIKKAPQTTVAYQSRALAHACLAHKDEALADLEQFQKGDSSESSRLYLAVVVAAEVGEGTDQAFEKLDAALQKQPQDARLHYDAACAYALASQPLAKKDPAKGRDRAERAIRLLQTAIQNGYSDYNHMQENADLDPIRNLPAFIEIMKVGHLDRSYAAVWTGDDRFEASPLFGLDTAAQLQQCRELASQGYRMLALSVARTSPGGLPIAASVWHRPVITEEVKDRLAERQARAAVALLRMGKAGEMMPLLHHNADPRLRSFIVNWLNPLGADPKLIVAELDRIDPNAKPTSAKGQQKMDAILFHLDTSERRALILALGTYGTEGLSPGEHEPLIGKLFDLYRSDPDAGIHGAAEWTLRQWKQQEKLKELDAELMKLKGRGDRRWFVNSQGQTFAVIEGPVEFRMGSPPSEPERLYNEMLHRVQIPRLFAIAATEVTVEQYREFVKENPGVDHGNSNKYSPDPKGPMNNVSWYDAAAYCNWLSRKEDLPECYEPNDRGKYAAGMRIKADALKLTGYRLPTEAEWEYACRSGAATSRYYGSSTDLLGRYAWYLATSPDRAFPCGSLLPNNLGLFDMLGNIYEWCQDLALPYRSGGTSIIIDTINDIEDVHEHDHRLLRGGSFDDQPVVVRSASRGWDAPSLRSSNDGFRPARTCH